MNHVDKFILAHRPDHMNTEPQTPLKLEPCPFCKSTDVVMTKHIYYGWKCFTPLCANCEAKGQVNIRYESDAAEKWNKLSQLERKLSTANARIVELEQALTGRTISCAACNEMAVARDRWKGCAERLKPFVDSFKGLWPAADAALAEYTRCAEGVATSEWRDIATAPKDGTYVLLWSRVPIVARWSKAQADKFPKHNGWDFPGPGFLKPTHWMPLPQPPQPTDV